MFLNFAIGKDLGQPIKQASGSLNKSTHPVEAQMTRLDSLSLDPPSGEGSETRNSRRKEKKMMTSSQVNAVVVTLAVLGDLKDQVRNRSP